MTALQKIEKFLFYTFLFLIPFQVRVFLNWGGNEWNSAFLYATDVIFLIVVLLWVWRDSKGFIADLRGSKRGLTRKNIFLWLFLIIAAVSLFFADNLGVGMFRFIKLLEFALLFLYVKIEADKRGSIRGLTQILIASGLIQSLLAIGQFLKQSSLGLKFIEAGTYAPGMPGVATFIMENGEKIMRAYGSFPHPNVLAGFILLTIFCLYRLSIGNPKSQILNPKQVQNPKSKILNGLLITSYGLLVFGLFITFSRTAIGVFLAMSLAMFLFYIKIEADKRRSKRGLTQKKAMGVVKLFGLFAVSCVISMALLFPYLQARFFTISFEEEAIDLRFFYNKMAFAMIKDRPFLGIGIGNFVPKLLPATGTPVAEGDLGVYHSGGYEPFLRAAKKMLNLGNVSDQEIPSWIYQPVHNIYLLIAVEMGIVGLVVFLLFIGTVLFKGFLLPLFARGETGSRPSGTSCGPNGTRRGRSPLVIEGFLVFCFLLLGLTDHYFWTLHSGGIIFWLALALMKIETGYKKIESS